MCFTCQTQRKCHNPLLFSRGTHVRGFISFYEFRIYYLQETRHLFVPLCLDLWLRFVLHSSWQSFWAVQKGTFLTIENCQFYLFKSFFESFYLVWENSDCVKILEKEIFKRFLSCLYFNSYCTINIWNRVKSLLNKIIHWHRKLLVKELFNIVSLRIIQNLKTII